MPKKRNVSRKNPKHYKKSVKNHHKKSVKNHNKKNHNKKSVKVSKKKLAEVNEQDRIRNENRVRELNEQISQLIERIQRLQRGTSIVSDDTQPQINAMTTQIRERIRDRMEHGQFIPEIRASFPPTIAAFPGIETILSEEEQNLSPHARQRRINCPNTTNYEKD